MARLGWVALGVLVGVVSGRVAARRSDPPQGPPVLASATRVELAAPPVAAPAEAARPAAPVPDATVPGTAPRPTPSPRPRPRPEQPTGRHAWVPPDETVAADVPDPVVPDPVEDPATGVDDVAPPRDDAPGAG